METLAKVVAGIGIIIFLLFIPLAFLNGVNGFAIDMFVLIGLVLVYSFFYDTLRMNVPIFTLIIFGHILHACGILGWYHTSPLPIQWDHIDHFVIMIGFGAMFFRFLAQWMDEGISKKNAAIILCVFFLATGAGALNEMTEFLGYLKLGYGDGAFMFGAGDGFEGLGAGSDVHTDLMDVVGGGWINTGWDLTFNALGTIVGIAIMLVIRALRKKSKNAYYFEPIESFSKRIE